MIEAVTDCNISVGQRLKYPGIGHAILLLAALIVLLIVISVGAVIAGMVLGYNLEKHPAIWGCINCLGFGVVLAAGAFFARAPLSEVFSLQPVRLSLSIPIVASAVGAMILLSDADNYVRSYLPAPAWMMELFKNLADGKSNFWGSFFTLAIAAPVTEELLFRGLILRGFLSRYSVAKSVLVSAILFGLIHLNPWQLASGVFLGLLLGWWFVRTRSLWPCLAGHALCNGMLLFVPLLPFQIRGFNAGEPLARAAEFQPLWFDLVGVVLLASGIWLFAALTHPHAVVKSNASASKER